MISIAADRGSEEIRAGAVEQGAELIQYSLRLADSRTDFQASVRRNMRLGILESYAQSLRFAHRKLESNKVREEIARLRVPDSKACYDCKISAAALKAMMP